MKLRGFFAILPLICSTVIAAPRTFVSAVTGADMNPCSRPSPCRSFTAAIAVTDVDGEVVALDSGGYGVVTIPFGVSIIAPAGVYAGISDFAGPAITVNGGDGAHIVLKNLFLNAQGGDVGIDANTVAALHVESCVINGFDSGILFDPSTPSSSLYVSNSMIRRSGIGVYMLTSSSRATLDSVRMHDNGTGVEADGGQVLVRNSVASGGTYGFSAQFGGTMTIEDSVASNNGYGFYANGNGSSTGAGVLTLTRCAATSNTSAGIRAQFQYSTIYVSDSTVATNNVGVSAVSNGAILSRCTDILAGMPPPACPAGHFTNTLQANTTDGAFSGSYSSN